MQKDNTSDISRQTSLLLKWALGILIGAMFSSECRAGWTRGGASDLVSISIDLTNSSSVNISTNGTSTEVSLSSTNDGIAEWGDWQTVCHATATGSASDSGVGISVSQDTSSAISGEESVLGFTVGSVVGTAVSTTYSWDGPPWGAQGTAAEPVSVHLSVDCDALSSQYVSVDVGTVSYAQGSANGSTLASIGILSDGSADDFYLHPIANANGIADSAGTADAVAYVDDGRTGIPNDNESYSPDSEVDIPTPHDGTESALCTYSIQLEEDEELSQGSVSFDATAEINSASNAHLEIDAEDHIGLIGCGGYSGFEGSASVEISGITIH